MSPFILRVQPSVQEVPSTAVCAKLNVNHHKTTTPSADGYLYRHHVQKHIEQGIHVLLQVNHGKKIEDELHLSVSRVECQLFHGQDALR